MTDSERARDARGETRVEPTDLDAIESDLDGVQSALDRLADGTYWTDEVTGDPIPSEVLERDPLSRRR